MDMHHIHTPTDRLLYLVLSLSLSWVVDSPEKVLTNQFTNIYIASTDPFFEMRSDPDPFFKINMVGSGF